MKATINGMVLEWAPSELVEYIERSSMAKNQTREHTTAQPANAEEQDKETGEAKTITPTWSTSRKTNPCYLISMVNGFRFKYDNFSRVAERLGVSSVTVSKYADNGKALRWYYISTK